MARNGHRNRDHRARAARCLRGGAAASAGTAFLSPGPAVLPLGLGALARTGPPAAGRALAARFAERVRAALLARSFGVVGDRSDCRLRPAALVAWDPRFISS